MSFLIPDINTFFLLHTHFFSLLVYHVPILSCNSTVYTLCTVSTWGSVYICKLYPYPLCLENRGFNCMHTCVLCTLLVSNHQFNWWFILGPPKGHCYCSPQRAVSQALLLARYKAVLLESSLLDSSACSFIYF